MNSRSIPIDPQCCGSMHLLTSVTDYSPLTIANAGLFFPNTILPTVRPSLNPPSYLIRPSTSPSPHRGLVHPRSGSNPPLQTRSLPLCPPFPLLHQIMPSLSQYSISLLLLALQPVAETASGDYEDRKTKKSLFFEEGPHLNAKLPASDGEACGMVLDGSGKEQWGKGKHVPKPDQKSILDIMVMRGRSRCDDERGASFSVGVSVGEALNGSLMRCKTCFNTMLCW